MIRILCFALSMVVFGINSVYTQTADGILVEEEPKCFVCGRTHTDFLHIHDQALLAYDDQIRELSSKLANLQKQNSSRYQRISEATRGNPNMALTVETVTTDVQAFAQIIPFVEEILEFYQRYGRRIGLGSSTRLRLSDVVAAMENPVLPEIIQTRQELELIEVRRKVYEELSVGFLEFPLFRVTTKLSTVSAELANIEDLKKQNGNLLARLLSEARLAYRDTKNPASLWEIIEENKQKIDADPRVHARDKTALYHSFLAELLDIGSIEYSVYLCPVCLTLFKNNASSPKFRVERFDKRIKRWDTTMHDFP